MKAGITRIVIMTWASYAVGTWGWVLLKGYDITFRTWVNPLRPFIWPAGQVPLIPGGQIWPSAPAARAPQAQAT